MVDLSGTENTVARCACSATSSCLLASLVLGLVWIKQYRSVFEQSLVRLLAHYSPVSAQLGHPLIPGHGKEQLLQGLHTASLLDGAEMMADCASSSSDERCKGLWSSCNTLLHSRARASHSSTTLPAARTVDVFKTYDFSVALLDPCLLSWGYGSLEARVVSCSEAVQGKCRN